MTERSKLEELTQEWLQWTLPGSQDHDFVLERLQNNRLEELEGIMSKRLVFGTAGIRGNMGPGFAQMNDLVIVQTSQGLAHYVLDYYSHDLDKIKASGVVIGFDGRHNSHRWAKIVATVFLSLGFKTHLYSRMTPTPWVAFAVRKHAMAIGIMVTASHNPKNDNGYKVYWSNGVQILSPHDGNIQKSILQNLKPAPSMTAILDKMNCLTYDGSSLLDPFDEVTREYFQILEHEKLLDKNHLNKDVRERIVYTPMHGVGSFFIDKTMEVSGFLPVIHVPEQKDPDPDFPTVKFPNPEEGKSALNLAMKVAEENDVIYILANDPDADRLAVAQRRRNGEWKVFTGNELGTLLGWFLHLVHATKNPGYDKSSLYYVVSTVSSKMLRTMAKMEGMNFEETLTGFKWMCTKAHEIEKDPSKTVLLAYEESIGYMCGSTVLDKDGITAALRMMELIAYLRLRESGKTLIDKLDDIYFKYGYHFNINSYFFNHDSALTQKIFQRIRTLDNGGYPKTVSGYAIKHIRDLTTGYDSSKPDGVATLPSSSSTQMITFTFENGFDITLRTSGTEPKLKYYAEMCGPPREEDRDHSKMEKEVRKMLDDILKELLEPDTNGLRPQQGH